MHWPAARNIVFVFGLVDGVCRRRAFTTTLGLYRWIAASDLIRVCDIRFGARQGCQRMQLCSTALRASSVRVGRFLQRRGSRHHSEALPAIGSGADAMPPGLVLEIPLHGLAQAALKRSREATSPARLPILPGSIA